MVYFFINRFNSIYGNTYISAFRICPFYSYSTPIFTWKAGPKKIGVELDNLTDDKPKFLLESNMRSGPASVLGYRYVKRSDTKKTILEYR